MPKLKNSNATFWVIFKQNVREVCLFVCLFVASGRPTGFTPYPTTLKDIISELKRSLYIYKSRLSTALLDTCTVQCHPNFFLLATLPMHQKPKSKEAFIKRLFRSWHFLKCSRCVKKVNLLYLPLTYLFLHLISVKWKIRLSTLISYLHGAMSLLNCGWARLLDALAY